jgi:hypothetical protein
MMDDDDRFYEETALDGQVRAFVSQDKILVVRLEPWDDVQAIRVFIGEGDVPVLVEPVEPR